MKIFAKVIGDKRKYIFLNQYIDIDSKSPKCNVIIENQYNNGDYEEKNIVSMDSNNVLITSRKNISQTYSLGFLKRVNNVFEVVDFYSEKRYELIDDLSNINRPLIGRHENFIIAYKLVYQDNQMAVAEFVEFVQF